MHRLSILAVLVATLAVAGVTVAGPLATTAVAQDPYGDSDGDGVPNQMDQCPTQPGPGRVYGCPDTDGDGVADKDDKCPTEAGTDRNGCPPDPDSDGVRGSADKCPDAYGPDRPDGCTNPVASVATNYGTISHVARNNSTAMDIICHSLPSDGGGCFFDVSLRLTPASARALGVRDRTVWHIRGEVGKYIDNGTDFGYGKWSKPIHIAPAMKRALRGARRASFELSGTFHWGHEPVQTLKDRHGHAVARFTKTRKLDRAGAGLSTPEPARAPKG